MKVDLDLLKNLIGPEIRQQAAEKAKGLAEEIRQLQVAHGLLLTLALEGVKPPARRRPKKARPSLSVAGRRNIVAAQRRRWKAYHKKNGKTR